MRRELAELVGSGLLLGGLVLALVVTLTSPGASVAAVAGTAATTDSTPASRPATVDAAETPPPRGLVLFRAKGCAACHILGPEGSAQIGPPLSGLADRAGTRRPGMSALDYVRESLRDPSAFKVPGYDFGSGEIGMPDLGLSNEEIETLAAFLLD